MQNSYSNSGRKTADRSCHIILNKRLLKLLFITTLLVSASGLSGMAQNPIAKIEATYAFVTVGVTYTFTGVTATDGDIMWTRSVPAAPGTFTDSTTQNPTFTPSGTGVIVFTLTVTNGTETATDQITLLCTDADPVYWDGSEEIGGTNWFNPKNWTPEVVPGSTTNVIIQNVTTNYPDITAAAECKDIFIEPGASLLGNQNLTINGTASMQLNVSKGSWHFIAAPNSSTYSGAFTGDYLQTWDELTAKWSYITATDAQLLPAKGYSLWSKGSGTASYTFNGKFLYGDQSQTITTTANKSGNDSSNLLGNPYPSYIDWASFNGKYGAVYYWNGTGYAVYNGGNGAGSQYVAPMQGFFIMAGANKSFNLTEANRVNIAGGKFYKSAKAINSNTLVLQTLGESYSDKLYIGINPGTTEGFDLQNDAYKLLAYTDGVSELYSYTGDKKLSIDVRPDAQVIQLGFTNTRSGEYQLGLQDIADIPVAMLEDTKTNTFHDLQAGAYSFSYTAGESDKRFLLHLGVSAVPEKTKSETSVYSNLNTVYIHIKGQMQGNITIYNIAGQQVASRQAAQGLNEIRIQQAGNYIVKVTTGKNTVVKKVYVQ